MYQENCLELNVESDWEIDDIIGGSGIQIVIEYEDIQSITVVQGANSDDTEFYQVSTFIESGDGWVEDYSHGLFNEPWNNDSKEETESMVQKLLEVMG